MWGTTVSIGDYARTEWVTNKENCDKVMDQINEDGSFTDEEKKIIKKALDILSSKECDLELNTYVDSIEVSEDEIIDAYNWFNDPEDSEAYNDGYEAALDAIDRNEKSFLLTNSLLLEKIRRLAYNYGSPETLTQDEILKLSNFLGL